MGGSELAYFQGKDAEERDDNYRADQERLRQQNKTTQYGLLNQMQGPQVSDATRLRIKALQDESRPTSLVEDPYFQAQRATVVRGGQQALAGVQNAQRAQGNSGGFSNQGSMADVYDRLGGQLAGLGQQSAEMKSQKADRAAQMEQEIANSQIAFQNAQTKARMAIESGDAAAASQALAEAFQAKQAADAAQRQMYAGIIGTAATAGGMALGGPLGGALGKKLAGTATDAMGSGGNTAMASPIVVSDLPWQSQRARYLG